MYQTSSDHDLKGLVDDLTDRIEQLNLGGDLVDTPILQDGLAHKNSPYWDLMNPTVLEEEEL